MSNLLNELEAILGSEGVLTGEDVSGRAAGIWTPEPIEALAILRPRDTAQVAEILTRCHAAGQSVVTHGGLTGVVDGARSTAQDVVISLERMCQIEEIDPLGRTMTVQAGVPLERVQQAAADAGLCFPLDLGARGSCTIGGNVATNAGGNHVLRYGMMRDQVLGLEAVTADGTVISSMNRMIKNNAGYDLKQLFVGTEGTLGIVTRVVLRLREAPTSQNVALVAVEGFEPLVGLLKQVDRELGGALSAFEVMWREFYQVVTTPPALSAPPLPQEHAYYVLIEAQGGHQERDEAQFLEVLEQCVEQGLVVDAAVARSAEQRRAMWAIRDDVEQTLRFGPSFIFDISLQVRQMEAYVRQVREAIDAGWPDNRTFTFGHLADGNLHFCVSVGDGSRQTRQQVAQCVYGPLGEIGGSVSAEHGIGMEKKPYLALSRTAQEIALMRSLKQALDPKQILNPGKVF